MTGFGSRVTMTMSAVYTKMHSPHLPLKIPALTDGPVLIPPARAGVCWSCPIVFGVHLQTSLPLALPAVHLHGAADLFRDVCGDVVVIVSPWTRASPSPQSFHTLQLLSRFPQIYQDPKNDSECLSNITEFLKGCAVFRVEVSWCVYGPLTLLYVAALAPQWKQSTKETCSRQRRRNWVRSCPAHRFIVTVWWDKSLVMLWKGR